MENNKHGNVISVGHGIYNIKVPLLNNPLRDLNAYLIKGERDLLIDTGFNMDECENVLVGAFNELDVDYDKLDIFITHLHGDHSGLLGRLYKEGMTLYCSEPDAKLIIYGADINYWLELETIFTEHGYPETNYMRTSNVHPGKKYNHGSKVKFDYVKDGDILTVGDNKLQCVLTPGHSPGHMCLYEQEKKILFSGDHVLGNISPNICPELGMDDPLTLYLKSLEYIKTFDVKEAYPGHRKMITEFSDRVDELIEHHHERLDEVISILKKYGEQTGYEVAQHMTWHTKHNIFSEFKRPQKLFATGEAISHLQHLHTLGKISRKKNGGRYKFSI